MAYLCLLPGQDIARIAKRTAGAALFAVVIVLPSAISGSAMNAAMLVGKVLLSLLAAALLSATTSWASLSTAFARLRVPDLFVMTLDMTVKYIALLGGLVVDMLYALKLRSIGRNERKTTSLSAIAGTLFLKSKEAAEEQYQAMECRCFGGTYRRPRRSSFGRRDAVFAFSNVCIIALFVLSEVHG